MSTLRRRPTVVLVVLVLALGAAAFWVARTGVSSAAATTAEPPVFAMLAVGDTGKRHRPLARLFETQLAVARGMVREDERSPVDALLLLGDNFYMTGLTHDELVPRLRENLVGPYCHFLDLSGPRSPEVASACDVQPAESRNAVPVYAVLGNHDLLAPESAGLQRNVVPEFVVGWHVPKRYAETIEFGAGVSLILYDSEVLPSKEQKQLLASELRRARGPWRILASHRPMSVAEDDGPHPHDVAAHVAIARSGVTVHVALAGHQHSLQLIRPEPRRARDPALEVLAGSGARTRPTIDRHHPNRRFGASEPGFARLELVGKGTSRRLHVSLHQTGRYPLFSASRATRVAHWSVGVDGDSRDELAGSAVPER